MFREGLREAGFVEGQNLVIAFRWAEGRYDRLPTLAADLVGLRVAVLLAAGGPPSALAANEDYDRCRIVGGIGAQCGIAGTISQKCAVGSELPLACSTIE
jgi:putative ABC transport system substrate-binding protein